ncbi:hypothetical protein B0F90DRAFT_675733 [Multifurca ochricompacta]|uniref:Uncharacterized protein n=1 Tax=Multifurca ochricompacta TaxID=376703 RepID=A0AAD4M3D0_9AGAM|nr:hypothetical protein B0F90DRAFT_675733 [Multifurca ochricompacta]
MAQSSTPTQAFARRSPPRTLQSDSSSVAAPQTPLGDDTSAKEEGEISDSEDPPFRPPSKLVPPPIMGAINATKVESSGVLRSPFVIASRSPSVKAEDAYQRATLPASATTPVGRYSIEAFPVELESETSSEGFRLETPLYVLDAHHVRPGLSLTQKQYDTSKEVILDILGYGVPPEYLIDCGLSREIIYYVFTELNLRLPNNLDVVGIPPYPPPQDVIASILLSQPSHSYSPSAIPSRSNVDGDTTQRSSLGAPGFSVQSTVSLEPIPHVVPPATTSASLDSSTSTSILALSESTLAVMERQRKQELLARKAVQASRKRKEPPTVTQVLTSPTSTASKGADASAKLPASAASVEDFLNSIGPPLSDTANSRGDLDAENSSGDMRASSPDPNSIDETIPGFGRTPSSDYELPEPLVDVTPAPLPPEALSLLRSASASEANFLVEREQDKTYPMMDNTSRVSENSPIPSRGDGVTIPQKTRDLGRDSQRSSSTPQSTAAIPRRGTKRPVAADFDSEPMPMAYTPSVLSRTGSGAGHSHVGAYHPNPHVRRKMNGVAAGGFASLSNSRRCVIDVSDSEDDASEEETPLVAIAPHVPQSQGASGSQPTARDTALALELEIERMRKMIREREEMKLRKQAMASSRLTAVSKEPTAVDVDVNVNVDVDVDIDVDIDTDVDVDKDERKRASEGQAQRTETESLHHPHPMVASASASASALSTFETTGVVEISRSETGSDKSSSENGEFLFKLLVAWVGWPFPCSSFLGIGSTETETEVLVPTGR